MNKNTFRSLCIAVIVLSMSALTVVATEIGPSGEIPEYTKTFNKIFYGEDKDKKVSEMLAEDIKPANAQSVCTGEECYTWEAFLDKNISSVPISLGDITRVSGVGNTISCGLNKAIHHITSDGTVNCIQVQQCYYAPSDCTSGFSSKGNNICCNF